MIITINKNNNSQDLVLVPILCTHPRDFFVAFLRQPATSNIRRFPFDVKDEVFVEHFDLCGIRVGTGPYRSVQVQTEIINYAVVWLLKSKAGIRELSPRFERLIGFFETLERLLKLKNLFQNTSRCSSTGKQACDNVKIGYLRLDFDAFPGRRSMEKEKTSTMDPSATTRLYCIRYVET